MQNHRNPEQDRRARAQRRAEKKITLNDFYKTYSFLTFWQNWGAMLMSVALGLVMFSVALCVGNSWMLDIVHTNGGVGGFFMIMAILGGILAAGGVGLAIGEFLAQQIEKLASIHYIIVYGRACSLGFATNDAEDDLFDKVIEPYLPETLAEMGPELQERICASHRPAPAHAATPTPSTEAANQRLHLIP